MGKHKIIKSAAAVALTASVVATAAAPGASAASYKTNAKDQLVHTSTGKLVKGWKVFGGKLYKNGKLAPAKKYKIIGTGAAQKLFYGPTLKKGYKTASSKTLLFKDGKLADGWKQAGKGERLYKNGKLDKGYTVYTNVEGDKFLYQNGKLKKGQKTATRGGETLLFVDGKLAKGYVLHEASKTLFNNGKVAEGLVKYPETDGKYYNNGKLADGEINGVTYKDGVIVAKDVASVKAINDTTVEVTFKEAQKAENIKAADFKIEGLTVSNAALKQTDSKVVVLTTSKQEAGKEYTITYKENDTKTFVGFNAAIPTAIKSTEVKPYQTSQQAKIGTQVTVKATVTVAEGANKAGIPVTFVVDNSNDTASGNTSNQGKDQTVEVLTDENGVASYTYTQYAASTDTVTAYATGAPTQRTSTNVFWGIAQPLTVADVTTESTLANNGKKVYKVTGEKASKYYVTFGENYEVTPDKVDKKAFVNDDNVSPFQSSISGKPVSSKVIEITTNDKGEATFSVTGTDTSVTPVVFKAYADSKLTQDQRETTIRLGQTDLQATASTVKFENKKTVGLTNQAQGTQKASAAKTGVTFEAMKENQGGRTYIATLTDDTGKTAAAGTKVYLDLNKNGVTNNKDGVKTPELHVFDADGKAASKVADNVYVLTTDKNGQVKYAISTPTQNSYVTPVVFLDNGGSKDLALDKDDTQTPGEITYFGDATVAKAELKVNKEDAANGLTVKYTDKVSVNYQTVDQNGFEYAPEKQTKVAFNFTTTFGKLTADNVEVATGNTNNKALEFTTDTNGEIQFTLKTDVDTTANITAAGNTVVSANATAKVVFEQVGKTTTVTAAELTAVNAATTTAAIDAALAGNDTYKTLTQAQKDEFAAKVLAQLKAGKTYNGAELAAAIDAAKASTPGESQAEKDKKAAAAVTAQIDALKVAGEKATAEEAKAIKEARTAYDALNADAKKLVTEATVKKLTDAEAKVEGEEKVVTVKDLGTAAVIDDADKATQGFSSLTIKLPELTGDLKDKTKFTVELADGTKIVLAANKFDKTKLYGEVPEKYTKAEIEAAKVTAE